MKRSSISTSLIAGFVLAAAGTVSAGQMPPTQPGGHRLPPLPCRITARCQPAPTTVQRGSDAERLPAASAPDRPPLIGQFRARRMPRSSVAAAGIEPAAVFLPVLPNGLFRLPRIRHNGRPEP